MAGSLSMIVDSDTGKFTMDLIENLGDAAEALEECFEIIYELSKGRMYNVNAVLRGMDLTHPELTHPMMLGELKQGLPVFGWEPDEKGYSDNGANLYFDDTKIGFVGDKEDAIKIKEAFDIARGQR